MKKVTTEDLGASRPVLATGKSPRRLLRKSWRWLLGISLALLVAALVLFALLDGILRSLAERIIHEKTGMKAEIGGLNLSFRTASLRLTDFRLFSLPEFGETLLLHLPSVSMELDRERSTLSKVHLRQLRLHLAELNVVRGVGGSMNLEALEGAFAPLTNSTSKKTDGLRLDGIDRMYLTVDRVNYRDLGEPSNNREFNLGIREELAQNIQSTDEADQWFGPFLLRVILKEAFKGQNRRIELTIDGVPQK